MANYFQIVPPLDFSHRLFIFTNRRNFQVRTWVWRKFAAENRVKEGIGQESNGAANQEKQIFLLRQISPSASSTRDLGTRLATRLCLVYGEDISWRTQKVADSSCWWEKSLINRCARNKFVSYFIPSVGCFWQFHQWEIGFCTFCQILGWGRGITIITLLALPHNPPPG